MTNADVLNMVAAGLSEQIITASIRDAKARSFDLGPNGLITLKKAGVSDVVITMMMNPGTAPPPSAPVAQAPMHASLLRGRQCSAIGQKT